MGAGGGQTKLGFNSQHVFGAQYDRENTAVAPIWFKIYIFGGVFAMTLVVVPSDPFFSSSYLLLS